MIRRGTVFVIGLLLLLGACGNGASKTTAPPRKVPVALAPPTLQNGKLHLIENTSPKTVKALRSTDPHVLIGDGRLWEIRNAQKLVGALEIATVKPAVRLARRKVRTTIVRNVMPGRVERLDIGELTVYSTVANDKVVYLWFGKTLFQVLQLKGSQLDPEALVTEIVQFQLDDDNLASNLLLGTGD